MATRTPLVLGNDGLPQQLQAGDSISSAQGFTQSLAANGYQKLPSGLIIQWGQAAPSSGTATITFPIAFPTACAAVTSSPVLSGVANTAMHASFTLTTSLTGCTIAVRTSSSALSSPSASTAPVQWHCIGY